MGALIVDIVFDMGAAVLKEKKPFFASLMPAAFAGSFLLGINVMVILLICVAACLVYYYLSAKRAVNTAVSRRPVPVPAQSRSHSDEKAEGNRRGETAQRHSRQGGAF